ncbi:signal peptidase I [Streptococcus zalophi]|uniref:Signal peptidase I n=1 Tax=Streptococcus zalophi TaxID=640031 RepID=A0A934P979_9STRE|nr:signal peptidase I [Streptococcus zalophi]MBJ8349313.1 signal peptidase I [Streptococcus zalophi]MCR8967059.1 signal peptidase I [Streptococcus zalophi]
MKHFIKEWGGFILFMTLFFLSWLFLWANVLVDGHSMDPTLSNGERLFVVKVSNIDRFDIVVAREEGDKKIVKRVIGVPGDTISYDNDILTVNGEVVDEPYLEDYQEAFEEDKLQKIYSYSALFKELALNSRAFTTNNDGNPSFSITVPEGQYYLLGDDRIVSKDSREVGTFSKESIIGEVKFRYWPLSRIGTFDND